MSEKGKLPAREEMISMSPGSFREPLAMLSCQLCRLLCNNQAPPKKTKEKSVIDMTNHAMSDLHCIHLVLFIANLFTFSIYLVPHILEAI